MSDGLIISMRAETLLARIAGTEQRLRAGMKGAVQRLSIKVQAAVKGEKLTGQVLHNRSGTLRRSINRVVTETPSGVFAQVGTNVRYAAVHEYGFDGPVNVRAHVRKTRTGGVANVRAFVRQMHMPKRSFLRSTLAEFTGEIQQTLRQAALQAVWP